MRPATYKHRVLLQPHKGTLASLSQRTYPKILNQKKPSCSEASLLFMQDEVPPNPSRSRPTFVQQSRHFRRAIRGQSLPVSAREPSPQLQRQLYHAHVISINQRSKMTLYSRLPVIPRRRRAAAPILQPDSEQSEAPPSTQLTRVQSTQETADYEFDQPALTSGEKLIRLQGLMASYFPG